MISLHAAHLILDTHIKRAFLYLRLLGQTIQWENHLKESANTPPAKTTTFDVLSMYILLKSSRWFSTNHHNSVNQLEKHWFKIVMPRSWNKLYTKKQWRSSLLQCRPPGYMDTFFIWALMTCPRISDAADYYKETTPQTSASKGHAHCHVLYS